MEYDMKEEEAMKTMAEKSPFGRLFKKIYENSLNTTTNGVCHNDYYLPEFIKTLVVFYMPLAPAWTGMMISSNENRQTRYFVHEFIK